MNITSKSLVAAVFTFFSFCANADQLLKDLQVRVPNYLICYYLNADGSFVEERSWTTKVLKEQALDDIKKVSVDYSTSIQKAEVIEAYTLKANGKRIDVPKSSYQITANGGKDDNQAIFSDSTTLTVVFPDVAVNDSVVFHYKLIAKEAIFPNQFSTSENFYKTDPYDDVKIKIDAPTSLKLNYETRELVEDKNAVENNRHIIIWSWKNSQPVSNDRQNYSVYNYDESPGFMVSTFNSHQEIVNAYGSRATPKAAVTERVRKLADEITKDKTSHDEIAHSLYDWVATNITYAGNCVGLGAVVPHDLDFIIENRMGDCKDHATLLQALLASKGIESTQALINAGSAYRLPKIPVVSMVNHVINYIPSMDLFLDSTSSSTPYRMLPYSDQSKPVLLVDGYKENSRTPAQSVNTNIQVFTSKVVINSDGAIKGESKIELKGSFATNTRARLRGYSQDSLDKLIKNNFKPMGGIATGELVTEDPQPLLDTYSYGAKYEVQSLYSFAKTGSLNLYPNFYNEAPISHFLGEARMEDVTYDIACSSGKSIESLTYELPPNIKVISVPENMEISNKWLTYKAEYELNGNLLIVKRVFDDKTEGNICNPDIVKEDKALLKKALENYSEQLLYKKIDS